MKEIELFYLTGCPYCQNARRAVEELTGADSAYATIPIRWIEESREKELADSRDYYYVPTLYCNGEKLFEANPGQGYEAIRDGIRRSFDRVLREK